MVHATGPAWHSMAGGRIDTLIRLDVRLGSDEGGPVLDQSGADALLGGSATLLGVFIIPVSFYVIEKLSHRFSRRRPTGPEAPQPPGGEKH